MATYGGASLEGPSILGSCCMYVYAILLLFLHLIVQLSNIGVLSFQIVHLLTIRRGEKFVIMATITASGRCPTAVSVSGLMPVFYGRLVKAAVTYREG